MIEDKASAKKLNKYISKEITIMREASDRRMAEAKLAFQREEAGLADADAVANGLRVKVCDYRSPNPIRFAAFGNQGRGRRRRGNV